MALPPAHHWIRLRLGPAALLHNGPIVTLLLLSALIVGPTGVRAQPADEAPAADDAPPADELKYEPGYVNFRSEIMAVLREDQPIPANLIDKFDKYFRNYALLEITLPKNAADLPTVRAKKIKPYFMGAKGGAPKARLNALAIDTMSRIIFKSTQPRDVKFNALLLLNDLTDAAGKPDPNTLPIFFKVLLSKPGALADSLKAAAMIGILRHAENPALEAEARAAILENAVVLLQAKKPPAGQSPAGHDWLRLQATDLVIALQEIGPKGAVVKVLDSIIFDPKEWWRLRIRAVEALGALSYPSGEKLGFAAVADHVGHLVVDIVNQEMARAKKDRVDVSRRLLKQTVRGALEALMGAGRGEGGGLLGAAPDAPQQKSIAAIRDNLLALDKVLDDTTLSKRKLTTALSDKLSALEGILQPIKAGSEPPSKDPGNDQALAGPEAKRPAGKRADAIAGDAAKR